MENIPNAVGKSFSYKFFVTGKYYSEIGVEIHFILFYENIQKTFLTIQEIIFFIYFLFFDYMNIIKFILYYLTCIFSI